MSDFTVTVQNTPIEVTSTVSNPIEVTVSPNVSSPSIDITNFLTTGDAYVLYYLNANPSGFVTELDAGSVISLNGLSGIINLSGINNTIFTSGQYLFISGLSGASSSLISLDEYNVVYRSGDQLISGNKTFKNSIFVDVGSTSSLGSAVKFVNEGQQHYTIGQSGANFLLANTSDLGNSIWGNSPYPLIFINEFNNVGINNTQPIGRLDISGNAYASGGKILTQTDSGNISVNIQNTGNNLYQYIINSSGNLSDRLYETGSNIIGLINAASAGVSSINGFSGIINLTGEGNVSVISSLGTIIVSGNGSVLDSGQFVHTGDLIKYNVFATSGVETEQISYPVTFSARPTTINCELENDRDNLIYSHSISGINTEGFWINYSDILSNSGYKILVTINR